MVKQLLIYENATPVSRARHGGLSVKAGGNFGFAAQINSVPLMAAEFAQVASDMAIVFAAAGDEVIPAVLLGIRENENLYVDDAGNWQGKYVPAFLRRYPFVFSTSDDGQNFTLCIDESFEGANNNGRGERLFDADGEQTQYLRSVLGFLQAYQVQFQRTRVLDDRRGVFVGQERETDRLRIGIHGLCIQQRGRGARQGDRGRGGGAANAVEEPATVHGGLRKRQ